MAARGLHRRPAHDRRDSLEFLPVSASGLGHRRGHRRFARGDLDGCASRSENTRESTGARVNVFALALILAAELGSVSFPTSTKNAAAQAEFERGVAALHSFWYDEAAAYFQRAQKLDPQFAMAYWGEAMTHNHPIWMEQDRDAARAILAKAPAAATPLERDWLA